jgi:hypothetical protein
VIVEAKNDLGALVALERCSRKFGRHALQGDLLGGVPRAIRVLHGTSYQIHRCGKRTSLNPSSTPGRS